MRAPCVLGRLDFRRLRHTGHFVRGSKSWSGASGVLLREGRQRPRLARHARDEASLRDRPGGGVLDLRLAVEAGRDPVANAVGAGANRWDLPFESAALTGCEGADGPPV